MAALYNSHSGTEHNQKLWGESFDNSCGFIFVIDNIERTAEKEKIENLFLEARKELETYQEKIKE